MPCVRMVRGDVCAFGMWRETEEGNTLVMKPTGFLDKCVGNAEELNEKCIGNRRHFKLLSGRASRAEVYPDEFCFRVLRELVEQVKIDGRMQAGGIGGG